MLDRTITIGCTTRFTMYFVDENGDAIDMTSSGRYATIRLTAEGATSPAYTRSTATAAQFTWTSEAGGYGVWDFRASESFTAGTYIAQAFLYESGLSPARTHLLGTATYTIENPDTGAL